MSLVQEVVVKKKENSLHAELRVVSEVSLPAEVKEGREVFLHEEVRVVSEVLHHEEANHQALLQGGVKGVDLVVQNEMIVLGQEVVIHHVIDHGVINHGVEMMKEANHLNLKTLRNWKFLRKLMQFR